MKNEIFHYFIRYYIKEMKINITYLNNTIN